MVSPNIRSHVMVLINELCCQSMYNDKKQITVVSSKVDLWPFGRKLLPLHFIRLDISVTFCLIYLLTFWICQRTCPRDLRPNLHLSSPELYWAVVSNRKNFPQAVPEMLGSQKSDGGEIIHYNQVYYNWPQALTFDRWIDAQRKGWTTWKRSILGSYTLLTALGKV